MIVRIVHVRFRADADVNAIVAEARRVFPRIPGVTGFRAGVPADHDQWDLVLEVEFASLEDVEPYRDHATHTAFVATWLRPHLGTLEARNYAF